MSEILAYYFSKGNKKIAAAMKKGFKAKLESMDPYLIDKYKMNKKNISLPLYNIQSANPTGKENIDKLLQNYTKHYEQIYKIRL